MKEFRQFAKFNYIPFCKGLLIRQIKWIFNKVDFCVYATQWPASPVSFSIFHYHNGNLFHMFPLPLWSNSNSAINRKRKKQNKTIEKQCHHFSKSVRRADSCLYSALNWNTLSHQLNRNRSIPVKFLWKYIRIPGQTIRCTINLVHFIEQLTGTLEIRIEQFVVFNRKLLSNAPVRAEPLPYRPSPAAPPIYCIHASCMRINNERIIGKDEINKRRCEYTQSFLLCVAPDNENAVDKCWKHTHNAHTWNMNETCIYTLFL